MTATPEVVRGIVGPGKPRPGSPRARYYAEIASDPNKVLWVVDPKATDQQEIHRQFATLLQVTLTRYKQLAELGVTEFVAGAEPHRLPELHVVVEHSDEALKERANRELVEAVTRMAPRTGVVFVLRTSEDEDS